MNKRTYGLCLMERPLDEGLTAKESDLLFNHLHGIKGIPIEIQAAHSSAMGWINLTDAEILDYDYDDSSKIANFIREILEDTNKENSDGSYTFDNGYNEIDILILR